MLAAKPGPPTRRTLQELLPRLCFIVLSAIAGEAEATVLRVTELADSGNGSLRQTILEAVDGDTVEFDVTGTIDLSSGEIAITQDVAIVGPGPSDLTVSAGNDSRLISVAAGANVTVGGLTLTQGMPSDCCGGAISNAGALTLNGVVINASSAQFGGGVFNNGGTLELIDCSLGDNTADFGGGLYALMGTLTVRDSTVTRNRASAGGGIYNNQGQLAVMGTTLDGNCAEGTDGGGIYDTGTTGTLTLLSVQLRNNCASRDGAGMFSNRPVTISGQSVVSNNRAVRNGGGVYAGSVSAVLVDVVAEGNEAGAGGALYLPGPGIAQLTATSIVDNTAVSRGGGILSEGVDLALLDCALEGNDGGSRGGGIAAIDGELHLQGTTVARNEAGVGGGLSHESEADLVIEDCDIVDNGRTGSGGGIFKRRGSTTIMRSTIAHNRSPVGEGGGIFFGGDDGDESLSIFGSTISANISRSGGGIFIERGILNLNLSTVSGNTADGLGRAASGGGIYASGQSSVVVQNATVVENLLIPVGLGTAGGVYASNGVQVSILQSILARNARGDCSGDVASLGHNLTGSCASSDAEGDIHVDPLLGPLQDNGGPTETHALLPGSPAIDAGSNEFCTGLDQRGFVRPTDGNGDFVPVCDIGAFEAFSTLATPTATATRTGTPPTSTSSPTPTETPLGPSPTVTTTPTVAGTASPSPANSPPTVTVSSTATRTPTASLPTATASSTESTTPAASTGTPTLTETPTLTVPMTPTRTVPSPTSTRTSTPNPTFATCAGNCDEGSEVTVDELILGVNIALGRSPLSLCMLFDSDDDRQVSINELTRAVSNSIYGCGVIPPTRTRTATPSRTRTPSRTATRSVTRTPSRTRTATPSVTLSPTVTQTRPPTGTPTRTTPPTKTTAPTRTQPRTATPRPTSTPRSVSSVCGGSVTSVPKLCNLSVRPNPVSSFGSIRIRFGISDLEGDIDLLCLGIAFPPLEPMVDCDFITPQGSLINEVLETDPLPLGGLSPGTYLIGINVSDSRGNDSNVVTASFEVR